MKDPKRKLRFGSNERYTEGVKTKRRFGLSEKYLADARMKSRNRFQ
jgi:hypothetical protein